MYKKSLNVLFWLFSLICFVADVEATQSTAKQQTNFAINRDGNQCLPGKEGRVPFGNSHLNDTPTTEGEAVVHIVEGHPLTQDRVGKTVLRGWAPYVTVDEQLYGRQVIGLADLHTEETFFGQPVRDSVLAVVECANSSGGSFCVVAGDCASRRTEKGYLKLNGPEITSFLGKLRDIFGDRLYIGLGNHDTQNPLEFSLFLKILAEKRITVLTTVKDFFLDTTSKAQPNIKNYDINGGVLFFPFCFNFPTGPDGALRKVFTEKAVRALENFDRDRMERTGRPPSLMYEYDDTSFSNLQYDKEIGEDAEWSGDWEEEAPGEPNMLVLDWLRKFRTAVVELAEQQRAQGNTNDPLNVVFIVHDYYLPFVTFLEKASRIDPAALGIDQSILRRLNVVVACGHSHCFYSLKKDIFITASDQSVVTVPAILGGPGIFGKGIWVANLDWKETALPEAVADDSVRPAALAITNAEPFTIGGSWPDGESPVERVRELEGQNRELRSQLASAVTEMSQGVARLEDLTRQWNTDKEGWKAERCKMTAEIERLRDEFAQGETQISELKQRVEAQTDKEQASTSSIANLEEEIARLRREHNDVVAQLEELRVKSATVQERLASKTEECTRAQEAELRARTDLQNEKTRDEQRIAELRNQLEELRAQSDAAREELTSKTEECDRAKEAELRARTDLQNEKTRDEQRIAVLNNQHEAQIAKLRSQYNTDIERLRSELARDTAASSREGIQYSQSASSPEAHGAHHEGEKYSVVKSVFGCCNNALLLLGIAVAWTTSLVLQKILLSGS
ncbi:MAG: hypothetical protein LBF72_03830 [Holosporales bacterium]|jgi:hypothetical protein|nr:hypothetical protein [Holosporales bacterium]